MYSGAVTEHPQQTTMDVLSPKKRDSLVEESPAAPTGFSLQTKSNPLLFDPRQHSRFRSVPTAELVTFNPRTQLSQLRRLTSRNKVPQLDHTTLVVFVSGACRGTAGGTRAARASYGIYFGAGSLYNTSDLLDTSLPQTIACAEAEALAAAIDMLGFITLRYAKFNTVKLVTDSQYLVEAMAAAWAPECQKEVHLRSPAHLERVVALRKKIELMEREEGIACQVWHLTEDRNAEAGQLALEALERI